MGLLCCDMTSGAQAGTGEGCGTELQLGLGCCSGNSFSSWVGSKAKLETFCVPESPPGSQLSSSELLSGAAQAVKSMSC